VKARTRLSRSASALKSVSRLRRQVASELGKLPTERIKKYATLSKDVTAGNPVLTLTRQEARKEILNRAGQLAVWEKGAVPSKHPLVPRVKAGFKDFLKFAGKAANVYSKALSGQWQQELEEAVSTYGMKPAERKAFIAKMRGERASYDQPVRQVDIPFEDMSVAKSAELLQKELRQARKEALA